MSRQNSQQALLTSSRRGSVRALQINDSTVSASFVGSPAGDDSERNEVEDLDVVPMRVLRESSTFVRRLENQPTMIPEPTRAELSDSSGDSSSDVDGSDFGTPDPKAKGASTVDPAAETPRPLAAASFSREPSLQKLEGAGTAPKSINVADLPVVPAGQHGSGGHRSPPLPKLPDDRMRKLQTAIVSTRDARAQLERAGSTARLIISTSQSWSGEDFTFGGVSSLLQTSADSTVLGLITKMREATAVAFSASESQKHGRACLRRARLQQNVKHLQEQREKAIRARADQLGCVREIDIPPEDPDLYNIYKRFDPKIEMFMNELVKIGPPKRALSSIMSREALLQKTVWDLRLPSCMNVKLTSPCFDALALMIKNYLERLPVLDHDQNVVGLVTLATIRNMHADAPVFEALQQEPVAYHFHEVKFHTTIGAVWQYFEDHPNSAAYVMQEGGDFGVRHLRVLITKSDLWQAEREEEVLPISTAEAKQYRPWLSIFLMILYPVVLIATLIYSTEFLNFNINPFFGPSQRTLIYIGAKYGQPILVEHSYWRIFTANYIHAGIIHVAGSMFFLFYFSMPFERMWGTFPTFIVLAASSILGYIVSTIAVPNSVGCGGTPAIMGILGASLIVLIHDWRERPDPVRELSVLLAAVVVLILAGFLPDLDNFAHISGFLCGCVTGVLVLKTITFGINRFFIFMLAAFFLAAFYLCATAGITMLRTTDAGCAFCEEYRCYNILSWCDHLE